MQKRLDRYIKRKKKNKYISYTGFNLLTKWFNLIISRKFKSVTYINRKYRKWISHSPIYENKSRFNYNFIKKKRKYCKRFVRQFYRQKRYFMLKKQQTFLAHKYRMRYYYYYYMLFKMILPNKKRRGLVYKLFRSNFYV